jgi:hypothetical protein
MPLSDKWLQMVQSCFKWKLPNKTLLTPIATSLSSTSMSLACLAKPAQQSGHLLHFPLDDWHDALLVVNKWLHLQHHPQQQVSLAWCYWRIRIKRECKNVDSWIVFWHQHHTDLKFKFVQTKPDNQHPILPHLTDPPNPYQNDGSANPQSCCPDSTSKWRIRQSSICPDSTSLNTS